MEKRCSGKEGDPHSPVIRVFHFLRRGRLRERGHMLDHKAVCFNLKLRKPLNKRRTVVSRKLKGFGFDAFNEMIGSSGL